MTVHSDLCEDICDYLKSLGAWFYRPNSHGYGRKGIPDILVCYRGQFIGIEVKVAPDDVTPWQRRELFGDGEGYVGITTAQGSALIVYKLEDVRKFFELKFKSRDVS